MSRKPFKQTCTHPGTSLIASVHVLKASRSPLPPSLPVASRRMRVNDNYTEINAAAQEDDPNSVLNFYRKMLKLRQEHKDSMVFGVFELLDKDNESTMTYLKKGEKETVAVVLNFSGKEQSFSIPGAKNKNLVVSSALNGKPSGDKLAAYEGRVYVVTA